LPQWASDEHGQRQDDDNGTLPSPMAIVPAKFSSGRANGKSIKTNEIDGKVIFPIRQFDAFYKISKIFFFI
jgi:hypothetical protein